MDDKEVVGVCFFVLVFVWLWYAATSTDLHNDAAAVMFALVTLSTLAVLVYQLFHQKESEQRTVVACVLWVVCVVVALFNVSWDSDAIRVLSRDDVYWFAMATALVVVSVLPQWGKVYAAAKDDLRILRARRVALSIVLCLLDVYTLYLLHEIVVVIDAEVDTASNITFNAQWHASVNIPTNREALCDSIDDNMQTYGLLYQNQVLRNETVSNKFQCLFELHELIRLNVLCAAVAWTIYRISTHTNGLQLLCTGMIFLAISTTVDDLRSYWVLGTEQAVFLTLAAVLECWTTLNGVVEDGIERRQMSNTMTETETECFLSGTEDAPHVILEF